MTGSPSGALPPPRLTHGVTARGLSYGRRGQGAPVVLIHGWCLSRRMWMYHEEALAERFDVITPDLPGFGGSAGLSGPFDLDRYVAELGAFLIELDLEHVSLVGFAFGAAVGMGLAAGDASRLSRLVAIGVPSAAHAAYERMPRAMRRDWPDFARRSARAICDQPHSEATLTWLEGLFAATPLPVALETVKLLALFEPSPLAPAVRVPALLVHGAQDTIVPVDVSRTCADAMARGRLEIVEGSGHLVVLDQKERLTELLLDFLGAA